MNFNPRPPRGGRPVNFSAVGNLELFQSTPSARRATTAAPYLVTASMISIHALREEGDRGIAALLPLLSYFNPRPPRGGRPGRACTASRLVLFQSTPSARRATRSGQQLLNAFVISIHALREEGDVCRFRVAARFNQFQSTPSARRATLVNGCFSTFFRISIHALREEGDACSGYRKGRSPISIHALREEGDVLPQSQTHFHLISIHALREEGDLAFLSASAMSRDFNPRPPRGGRLEFVCLLVQGVQFQSTPSARRATPLDNPPEGYLCISIHALREEGDRVFWGF